MELEIIQKQQLTPGKPAPLSAPGTLAEAVSEYLFKISFDHAPKTVKTYNDSLNNMVLFCGADTPADDIEPEIMVKWLQDAATRRSAPGVFMLWQAAAYFWRWYWIAAPEADPLRDIHLRRPRRDPIPGISRPEVEKMIKAAPAGKTQARDRAIIAVLYCSALRRAEFCGLKIADVNLITGAINARAENAKRGKFRAVYISGRALMLLKKYVKTLDVTDPAAALWQAPDGHALTASGIHQILMRSAAAAEVPAYDFHDFRRGCAAEMHRAGADIKDISHFLGHADLKTTEIYIKMDDRDTKATAARFDPLKG